MSAIFYLFACQAPAVSGPLGGGPDEVETIPAVEEDTGETETTGSSPDFFDDQVVHHVEIVMSREAASSLNKLPKEYAEVAVSMDGTWLKHVGVRLKGSSSMRGLTQKAAFKLDFDAFEPDQHYQGIPKITLQNMVNDVTQLHEAIAWKFFGAIGQPQNRAAYTWVTVTIGDQVSDFGLYLALETWNGDWTERNFGDREGNLYEGGYPNYPDGWEHADFKSREAVNFELEYGTPDDNAELIAASEVLGKAAQNWATNAAPFLDVSTFVDYFVGEAWVGHWDGYIYATNNFRVRTIPSTGMVQVLPSGLDWTFTDYGAWGTPRSALGSGCYRDPSCKTLVKTRAEEICASLDTAMLLSEFDRFQTLIQPYTDEDPRAEYNKRQLAQEQSNMRSWISTRCSNLPSLLQR